VRRNIDVRLVEYTIFTVSELAIARENEAAPSEPRTVVDGILVHKLQAQEDGRAEF